MYLYGRHFTLHTDHQALTALLATFIRHIRTAFYHPEANGGVKRLNQSLKNWIRAHLAEDLPFSMATPHRTTGSSPGLLMLGQELQLPLNWLQAPAAAMPSSSILPERQG